MKTNLAEKDERENAILAFMTRGMGVNQFCVGEGYAAENDTQLTASYEYSPKHKAASAAYGLPLTGDVGGASLGLENSNLKGCLYNWDTLEKETSFAAIENEFIPLQSEIQRRSLSNMLESLYSTIYNEILERFSYQSPYDYDTFERVMGDLIKELVAEEKLKAARNILNILLSYFPDSNEYKKLQKLIAPPELKKATAKKPTGISKTVSFFRQKGKEYANEWVAVSEGQLLDTSDSYAELAEKFKNNKNVVVAKMV